MSKGKISVKVQTSSGTINIKIGQGKIIKALIYKTLEKLGYKDVHLIDLKEYTVIYKEETMSYHKTLQTCGIKDGSEVVLQPDPEYI